MARYGTIDSPNVIDTTCEVVYDSGELTATATSITISNLDGNSDKEYTLISRVIQGIASGSETYSLFPNNDTTAGNYGTQTITGSNASATANRLTSNTRGLGGYYGIGQLGGIGQTLFSQDIIYAKAGKVRTCLHKEANQISGTTVDTVMQGGSVWNNTIDNITSLVIQGSAANDIGIGVGLSSLRSVNLPLAPRQAR